MLTCPDPATDLWKTGRHPLDSIFAPRSVAVIGATERPGSVGRTVLWNLISHPFGGTVYPINPKRRNVLGIQAFDRIASLPEAPNLAIIAIPAPGVPAVVQDCVDAGAKGAIILSAGFKEIGPEGIELEQQIKAIAAGRLRIIGPTCLGIQPPPSPASMPPSPARWPGGATSASLARAVRCAPQFWIGACGKMSALAPLSPWVRCSMWAGAT